MTHQLRIFPWTVTFLMTGLFILCVLFAASPSFASLTVTDPEGEPPSEHFTDLTMVPGDAQSTTVLLAQDTDYTVRAGVKLLPLAELAELHEFVEITIEGLGSAHTMSLREAMQRESPICLGELPPQQDTDITLTAHLPFTVGNETQQTDARFEMIFTAQQIPPGEPGCPTETPPLTESEDNSAASPPGHLPGTGSQSLLFGLLATGLLAAGCTVRRTTRKDRQ